MPNPLPHQPDSIRSDLVAALEETITRTLALQRCFIQNSKDSSQVKRIWANLCLIRTALDALEWPNTECEFQFPDSVKNEIHNWYADAFPNPGPYHQRPPPAPDQYPPTPTAPTEVPPLP